MALSDLNRREFCPQHGWVGRSRFQLERHDLCDASDAEADVNAEDLPGQEAPASAPILFEGERVPLDKRTKRRRRRRKVREMPPKRTLAVRRITRLALEVGRVELQVLGADAPYGRPMTRGACQWCAVCQLRRDGRREALDATGRLVCGHDDDEVVFRSRPCVFVTCKHTLYLDVSEIGSISFNFPHLEPEQMPMNQSCALDLAALGGMTLDQVGAVQAVTRERARQIEVKALDELLIRMKAGGIDVDDVRAFLQRHVAGPSEVAGNSGIEGDDPGDKGKPV